MSVASKSAAPRLAQLRLNDYQLDPALLNRLCTPAPVIYEERIRNNIRTVLNLMDGDTTRWRPHLKTVKGHL
ncbi:MAG: hypothetical protein GKR94_17890 [Gammaproteobacteria bacterium]|nr:hypothetical protein [Gammaproteobacteria bacterium]